MRFVLCLLALLVAFPVRADVDGVVTMRDGRTIDVKITAAVFELSAAFGKASIEASHITSIEFGKGAGFDSVLTDDGTRLTGRVQGELADLLGLPSTTPGFPRDSIASLSVVRRAELKPGEITDGVARNGVSYHLRAPDGYAPPAPENAEAAARVPAVLILHGSNMSSKAYVHTMATRWPEIARRYILIGINGEKRNTTADGREPTFNYTYVSYVGKSKYEGYPGTDRESPALVAEVVTELRDRLPIGRIFVGGHSQGGFLTYSLIMNTPELFAGAFPISAGLIFQSEPGAYTDAELIAKQKRVPLIIVHATNDKVVSFDMGKYAWEVFEDAGYPMVRLMDDEIGAHMFARLPIDEAIEWIEKMTSDDPNVLLDAAQKWMDEGHERDAAAVLQRLGEMTLDEAAKARRAELDKQLAAKASEEAAPFVDAIKASGDSGAWVDDFLVYRARFGAAAAGQEPTVRYTELRAKQQELAEDLFGKARQAFNTGDQKKAKELAARIVKECYASDKYRLAKGWLKEQ